jgi:hypothetical protein
MNTNNNTKTLAELLPNGYTYQNGINPGPRKLAQFQAALKARQTPALYANDVQGMNALATVKFFDPCGSWTWYASEWDGKTEIFGLVNGFESELGYVDLEDLANQPGAMGIGIEIDMHWLPKALQACREEF